MAILEHMGLHPLLTTPHDVLELLDRASALHGVANVQMCCYCAANVLLMCCSCVANVLLMCCQCAANVLLMCF